MDWLEEQLMLIRRRQTSLRQTLLLNIIIGIFFVVIAYLITAKVCQDWERLVLNRSEVDGVLVQNMLDPSDERLYNVLVFVRQFSVIVYAVIAIIWVTQRFYQDKIEQPLKILKQEIEVIASGDLTVPCFYQGGDEFEEVCAGFDQMRLSLLAGEQAINDLHVEQRKINAAFSHDIRTPLAVIQGNVELLEKLAEKDLLTEEKLAKSLTKISNHVVRLQDFSEMMQQIQRMDERVLVKQTETFQPLVEALKDLLAHIEQEPIRTRLAVDFSPKQSGTYDQQVILEVVENLLANALRFAKSEIQVTLRLSETYLSVFVKDNGPGFSREVLYQATQPYFSGDPEHFGLGLTICQSLIKKHGGQLRISNGLNGGSIISAAFSIV